MADARESQRNDARDDQRPAGGVGEHRPGQGSVESLVLPVEGLDRRLGRVRQRQNPFGRTSARSRRR